MEYSDEHLNFFRLCHIVFDIVPEGLRKIFKQEWDALYTTAHGQWDDTPVSYASFYSMESTGSRTRNRRLLGLMSNGNRAKWDCTSLFHAILFSGSVGPNIRPVVKTSVDDLREIRNEVVAHKNVGKLNDVEFKMSIQKIKVALSSLKLDITKIKKTEKRADFITQEQINKIKKELETIRKESEETKKELEDEKRRNTEPKSFCVLPPKPSHDTMERTKEVDDLFQAMQQLSIEKNGETTTVYLSGNPGSGKSVMARQVGEKYYDSDDSKETLRFVMTLNASTMDTLLNSYAVFAERLNCYQHCITSITTSKDLISKEDQILQLKALANKQVTKYSSWLIIVDNVVDLKSFSQYWQQSGEKTSGKGQILVTTQDSPSISVSSYSHHISLSSGMTENDAIELLQKVSGYRSEDNNIMLEVSRALDFQPLALSSTAVYMRSVRTINKQYSWHQCLEQVEKERERLEKVYEKTSLTYILTMTAAVNLALQREMNDEIMLHAFRFLSVIARDPIPLTYVVEYVVKCLPEEDRNLVALKLCSSSLVLSLTQEAKEISIHQVVYHCLQTNPKITERKVNMFTVISAFHSLLNMSEEKKQVDNLIATRPLLNHLTKISKGIFEFVMNDIESEKGLNDQTMEVLNNFSNVLHENNFFENAQHSWQVLLALQTSKPPSSKAREILIVLKDDHIKYISSLNENEINPLVSITLHNLGTVYAQLGQLQESMKYYEKALTIETAAYGEHHSSVGDTLNNLGMLYRELGQLQQSMKYYEKALTIETAAYVENHPKVGDTLNNLGVVYQELGQLQESMKYYEKALTIKTAAYGENHPKVGDTLNNLGTVYAKLGQLQESIKYYEKALAIYTATYVENHPSVGDTLNNLGTVYAKLGQSQESIKYYEKALTIYTAAYVENHPKVGYILNNLGVVYRELGQLQESTKYHEKALTIYTAAYVENHPNVGDTLNNLGVVYQELGQLQESMKYYEKALNIKTAAYGEHHSTVGNTLNNLGAVYGKLGQLQESIKYYKKALTIYTAAYGENHPSVGDTLNNLGVVYKALGQLQESIKYYEKALTIYTSAYGEHHSLVGDPLYNLGTVYGELGQLQESINYYEKALTIYTAAYGENHPSVGNTLNNLGVVYQELGQLHESIKYYEKALTIYTAAYGEHHSSVGNTLNNLGTVYKELGQLQEYIN